MAKPEGWEFNPEAEAKERQFGAWGTVDQFSDSSGGTAFAHTSLLGRGYTGHEHFFEVGLIHMNGRMYDAQVGRFLSPDNFIQDVLNTQNYNRYGYVMNSPLMYTDPSGEFLVAALIGAAVGILTNGINNAIQGRPFFEGAGKSALFGAIGGAAAFGIGQIANNISSSMISNFVTVSATKAVTAAFQVASHALLGGTLSAIQGGKFGAGALAGGLSSLTGSASGLATQRVTSKVWKAVGVVGSGSIAGGIGSTLAGGNFWDGVRQGAISSGLNHGVHSGAFGKNIAIAAITQRVRHIFGPDAVAVSGNLISAPVVGVKLEKGGIILQRGPNKGGFEWFDGLAGVVGLPTISGEVSVTELFFSGSVNEINFDVFTGSYHELNFGGDVGISIGVHGSISINSATKQFVIGTGVNVGLGFSPVYGIDFNYQYGIMDTDGNPFR
ncbi:MAG: RHS repeat-associated core domain-containing protein [Bacteroidota bacterium]